MIFLVCLFFTSGFLDSSEKKELSHGGSLYNGRKQVLYFADALSEVAFVVPNLPEAKTSSSETCECTPPPPPCWEYITLTSLILGCILLHMADNIVFLQWQIHGIKKVEKLINIWEVYNWGCRDGVGGVRILVEVQP